MKRSSLPHKPLPDPSRRCARTRCRNEAVAGLADRGGLREALSAPLLCAKHLLAPTRTKYAVPRAERCERSRCPNRHADATKSPRLCVRHERTRGKSRFGERRVKTASGRAAGSGWEAERSAELALMERAGIISDLRHQVRFDLVVGDILIESYYADSVYTRNGAQIIEDAKNGLLTDTYRRKRKWMAATGRPIYECHKPRK